jgi:MvaI/BcnI restriction endonuclease family
MVKIDRTQRKVLISFDATKVAPKHTLWLQEVERRAGLGELNPQPYWGFDDLEHIAGAKLLNCFYIQADVKHEAGREYYWYRKALMLQKFNFEGFLQALENASMLVDFDARTGHNHGTKFRLRQNYFPALYTQKTVIVSTGDQLEQEKLIA